MLLQIPDLTFLGTYAGHPVTLSILTIGAIIIIIVWKIAPHMKELMEAVKGSNKDLKTLLEKVIASDEKQSKMITDLQSGMRNNTLDILRITIYNSEVPIEDRLVAARRYFILGGNGKVAHFVKPLIAQYTSEWSVVIAISTEDERLKIKAILEAAV
jgi:hypothetical protein